MSRASQFLRNVSSSYVLVGIDATLLILLTPYVIHKLGLEAYAVWIIIQTISYYLDFLDIGLPDAQVRQHAKLLSTGDLKSIRRLHGTALILYVGAGLLAVVVATLIAVLPTATLFDVPQKLADDFDVIMILVGVGVFFSFIETGIDGVFEGQQRFDISNAIDVTITVLSAACTVALLHYGFGLVALALLHIAMSILGSVVKLLAASKVFSRDIAPELGFDRESWRSVRSYSVWDSLNEIVTEGTAHFDKLLIPVLLGSALVTPYSLVLTICAAIFVLAEPLTDVFLPMSAHRFGKNDTPALATMLTRGSRLVVTVTLPVTVVVVVFGHAILDVWIGPAFTDIQPAVLYFTAMNFFFSTFLWTSLTILLGAGEVRRVFRYSVLEVLLVLLLIVLLVPQLGLPGLALAGLIANVATGLFLFLPAACRLTGSDARLLTARTLILPLRLTIPLCFAAIVVTEWLRPQGWIELLFGAAATGLVCLAILLAFGTSRWERYRYLATLRRLRAS